LSRTNPSETPPVVPYIVAVKWGIDGTYRLIGSVTSETRFVSALSLAISARICADFLNDSSRRKRPISESRVVTNSFTAARNVSLVSLGMYFVVLSTIA
jgi:hypothetical protein